MAILVIMVIIIVVLNLFANVIIFLFNCLITSMGKNLICFITLL